MLRRLTLSCPLPGIVLRCHNLTGLGSACASGLPLVVGPGAKHIRASCRRTMATAKHLSSASPGLRGVPIHGRRNHHVHRTFVTPRSCIVISTSCSRVRLHVVTRLSHSGNLLATFTRKGSVRQTATTRIFNLPLRAIADRRHHDTGTVGFNLVCNVDTFNLTQRLGVPHGRTRGCVSLCFRHCPNILRCVRHAHTRTGRRNCIRALSKHHLCLPSVGSDGNTHHTTTRHTTVGTPVRKATTSVVGQTVVTIST